MERRNRRGTKIKVKGGTYRNRGGDRDDDAACDILMCDEWRVEERKR